MKLPKRILKQIKYVRGDGYKIIHKDGTVSVETYYSKHGAALMIQGRFNAHSFTP